MRKLYESKDASLNVSVDVSWRRLIFGGAYQEAPFNADIGMRMFVIHLAFASVTFTRFFVRERPPERSKHDGFRSPTKQSGKGKRKKR